MGAEVLGTLGACLAHRAHLQESRVRDSPGLLNPSLPFPYCALLLWVGKASRFKLSGDRRTPGPSGPSPGAGCDGRALDEAVPASAPFFGAGVSPRRLRRHGGLSGLC